MKTYDVQAIEIAVPFRKAFDLIQNPSRLPDWTSGFASADTRRAVMRTPNGEVTIELETNASLAQGTVDWRMTFPDGSVANAFSRVVPAAESRCVFTFVLTPPPVPLEQLEGALEAQSRTLTHELQSLKGLLERE